MLISDLFESIYDWLFEGRLETLTSMFSDKLAVALAKDPYFDKPENVTPKVAADFIKHVHDDIDPTPGKYTQWLITQIIKGNLKYEDTYKYNEYLQLFDKFKKSLEQKDLNQYDAASLQNLAVELRDRAEADTQGQSRGAVKRRGKKQQGTKDAPLMYEDGDWQVFKPETYEASCSLGTDTEWCTATTSNRKYYDDYSDRGDLYIFIDKRDPTEKYQLFIPNGRYNYDKDRNDFMDKNDRDVWDSNSPVKKCPYLKQLSMATPGLATQYARDVIGGRWPEAEHIIAKEPFLSYDYAIDVIGGRFPEAEPIIAQDPELASHYAENVMGGRFAEAEFKIAKDPSLAYSYAKDVIGGRWPVAELKIAKDPYWVTPYARDVIGGRWPEAEATIAKNPELAYKYAKEVIGGRWPEAEATIAKDPYYALRYAKDVIGGRWPEAEDTIAKDPHWARRYKNELYPDFKY